MIQSFLTKFGGISSKMAIQLAYKDTESAQKAANEGSDVDANSLNGGPADDEDEDEEALQGVYIKAYCSGVSEILQVYKEHLLSIEREYLKDRSLTIVSIQMRLGLYQQLFPALTSMNAEI